MPILEYTNKKLEDKNETEVDLEVELQPVVVSIANSFIRSM